MFSKLQYMTCFALVVFFCIATPVPADAQLGNLLGGLSGNIQQQAASFLKQRLAKALGADTPLMLDQSTSFPEAPPPDNFNPKKLTSISDLNRPLPPGDYSVDAQFYCTRWSIHRPPEGLPYKLGRAQGRLVKPMCALLNRGTLQGIDPNILETDAWRIQSGIELGQWPASDQTLVHKLIPDYEQTLQGDYLQKIQDDYDKKYKFLTHKSFDDMLSQLGDVGADVQSLEQEREVLTNQSISDDQVPDMLYQQAGNGGSTAPVADSSHPSPWMQIQPGVIGRYTIIGGYLQKNLFEFRVTSDMTKPAVYLTDGQTETFASPTLAQIMGMDESQWQDGQCDMLGYPIDQSAQDPIITACLGPGPPQSQVGRITIYSGGTMGIHQAIAITTSKGVFTFGFGPMTAWPFGDGWLPIAPGRVDQNNQGYANITGGHPIASYTLPDGEAEHLVQDLQLATKDPEWYILFVNDCHTFAHESFPNNNLFQFEMNYLFTVIGGSEQSY